MDSSNILNPTAISSLSIFSKLKRFVAASILGDWVLGNAFNVYISYLNQKGLLGLGSDFDTTALIWGETVWINILHVLILAFTAGSFGFIFGYLSKKLSLTEKIIFTSLYVSFRFLFWGLLSIAANSFFPHLSEAFSKPINDAFLAISSSFFNVIFILLGYIAMITSSIYFMKLGEIVINDPNYTIDKSVNGTFLDIKWYHYFWFSITIAFYSQIILNLIYKLGQSFGSLITVFILVPIFGVPEGNDGDIVYKALRDIVPFIIVLVLVISAMNYLRKILISQTHQHWAVKTLIVLAIGIVLPFLYLIYVDHRW